MLLELPKTRRSASGGSPPDWQALERRLRGVRTRSRAHGRPARARSRGPARTAQNEVCQVLERAPRELQKRLHETVARALTTDWGPLAGRRRLRGVAAQAVGAAAAEEAVSADGIRDVLAVVWLRRGGGSYPAPSPVLTT